MKVVFAEVEAKWISLLQPIKNKRHSAAAFHVDMF